MGVYIKNIDSVTHIFRGRTVTAGSYLQIPELERPVWHSDSTILQHVTDDEAQITKDDSGSNDIIDKAEQWAYLGNLVSDGVVVTNEKIPIFDEFTSSEKIPQFACAQGTFDPVTRECILEIKCPGTFPEVGRYLKDGYSFTDVYHFGDKVIKLEVVDKDDLLGYGAGAVVKSYHDTALPTDQQGWFLWAGNAGIGEVDLENAGGWGMFVSGLYLRATFKKEITSLATKAAINVFWACDETS